MSGEAVSYNGSTHSPNETIVAVESVARKYLTVGRQGLRFRHPLAWSFLPERPTASLLEVMIDVSTLACRERTAFLMEAALLYDLKL